MPYRQCEAEVSTQSAATSNNKPEYSPEWEDDSLGIQSDCAETESGFLTPKTKVADVQHVEPHLLVVEVGAMDSKWPDEGMDTPKAPDKGSQCAGDEMSSEALETRGDLPFTTCERTETQTGHRKPETEVVDMQQVVNVKHGRTNAQIHSKTHLVVTKTHWTAQVTALRLRLGM
ncbi:hypothetical protein F5141DRAFT_1108844 [Pisolithus sp. B1]|nr:hypothetical protein F5141DRAFT_1108844 [Pisolithus sp. B1]